MRTFRQGLLTGAMIAAVIGGWALTRPVQAQSPLPPQPLVAEVAMLRAQVAELTRKPTAADYTKVFSDTRTEAMQACKDVKGKLWINISYQGQIRTVSVSCELAK